LKLPWKKKYEPFVAELPNESGDTQLNVHNETWQYIQNYCLARLDDLRKQNDNPKLTEQKTAVIRGGIKELDQVLELATKDKL